MPEQDRPPRIPTRRSRQAEQTRREILLAAQGLFAANGYSGTTVQQIAAKAEVSVQTIYDSLGSKRAIVLALNDSIDEAGEVGALAARIPTTMDPVAVLDIAVTISHNINERCEQIIGAVFSAARVEPELAAVREESRRRHRAGIRWLTGRLAELEALRPELNLDEAADTIAALTDPELARTFVVGYGWTWGRWHAWTLQSLSMLVLRAQ